MRSIYTSDYYGWTQQQAELLRAGKLGDLDVNNLLEELESMGGSERRELESRLEVLFMHLLKWTYQPNFRGKSWTLTIKEQRRKIARRLEKSPSLKRELSEMAVESYGDAILSAARETGLDEENFPPEMPWTLADALREDFMPE
ncbi:DUF29 domain-containing protein [Salmonella enterica]|uniref:DUF29 domain-containing protein n=3 Tax=Salmonella houtenae TaxID=59205 RepID=A0A702LI10_SALHO|nr:DUF29 domain-containing protein [Salmonella enterica subsp. enterica]EAB2656196.1 DUF29 domain-containing protein [Salmonella enterica]EBH8334026.1 DUF29 domain-containing protein [Salmonella enterica subsp. houtenae serovar Houten]ECD9351649.1 DUF29 domain-containing protein [Salmonella enterica subsp. houtenae]ECT3982477.1 DUF29 domain-containing protein [Salmonella enterica subsp. houtenae serovar 53:z4,z23:-]EDT6512189.1 DUF29 domain-containing protein [Salmonella enterica subsp. enteri